MIAELSRDVVDCLEQIDVARERRKRRRAEVRHARDVDGWTNSVVDRRIEPAVRELKTRFVECATAKRGDVADLRRLICITQSRTTADRVQSADVARVRGFYVIETVARAELIALVDAMIDAREEIRGVETGGHNARLNRRPTVANCAQTIVNRGDCIRGNRQNRGIVAPRLFEVRKEERTFATQWTTHCPAVLRLRQQIFC